MWPHLRLNLSFQSSAYLVIGAILVFSPLWEGGTTHSAVLVIRLLILTLAAVFWWDAIRQGRLNCPMMPIGWPTACFLGLATISTVTSPYTAQSCQWLIVVTGYSLLLYLLVSFIRAWNHVVALLVVLIVIGGIEAALVFVQWGEINGRPSGTFFNPNFLGGYLVAISLVVLGCASSFSSDTLKENAQEWGGRIPVVLGTLLCIGFVVAANLTGSRGAALAWVVGATFILGMRFGKKGVGFVAAVLTAVMVLPSPLTSRVVSEHVFNAVSYARWEIWTSAMAGIQDHPFGVGLGLFQYVYPRYAFPVEGEIVRYGYVATTAHNEYLQMGLEMGVAGLAVFCWGIGLLCREAKWFLAQSLTSWQRGIVVGVLGAVISMLVHAGVDSTFHEPALAIVLILCVSIVMAGRSLSGDMDVRRSLMLGRLRPLYGVVGLVLIVGMGLHITTLARAWSWFEVGEQHLSKQEYEAAQRAYEVAASYDPGKSSYRNALALVHFRRFEREGNLEEGQKALAELTVASALNPLDGRLLALHGRVYLALATSLGPSESLSLEMRGLKAQWLRSAEKEYRHAIEFEPYAAAHYFQLALLNRALKNEPDAMGFANKAIELEPNYLSARAWRLRRYLEASDYDQARQELDQISSRYQRFGTRSSSLLERDLLAVNLAELEALFTKRPKA